MRPSLTEYFLKIALDVSERSTCFRKRYGAVIVKNGFIISTGYNGPPSNEPHCTACVKSSHGKDMKDYLECPAVHAEMNALLRASYNDTQGADLYLAGFDVVENAEHPNPIPCEICLRLIKNAGIARVINRTGVVCKRNADGVMYRVNNAVSTNYEKSCVYYYAKPGLTHVLLATGIKQDNLHATILHKEPINSDDYVNLQVDMTNLTGGVMESIFGDELTYFGDIPSEAIKRA